MKSQIFKKHIPKELLIEFLNKICERGKNYFILNKISYKKAIYENILSSFNEQILPFYHESKKYYITRKQSYTSFVTVVRQICKLNLINYTNKILYNKSSYDIIYYIYD